ncbi:acyl-CoA hydrolase [Ornatilinea apprima]|uniref:Acyl-CoA hydrolase n=1 Tax=Ornatilinea apprima TaxID=1134406 RepID=A0A0P6X856_9CHLR|nr:hotdog domain-containing protein [Ornatilinea apprima]KPL71357.1 acyl-CoA hydrolase [Ornatilinea apprima]
MAFTLFTTHRLIKSEDLNHHGTLYAGRSAEWFVESGFVAAASLLPPENIVCLKIHGMTFRQPANPGEIPVFQSRIVFAGRSSLVAHVRVRVREKELVSGFITFIHVDQQGNPQPHGIVLQADTDEEKQIAEAAKNLPR